MEGLLLAESLKSFRMSSNLSESGPPVSSFRLLRYRPWGEELGILWRRVRRALVAIARLSSVLLLWLIIMGALVFFRVFSRIMRLVSVPVNEAFRMELLLIAGSAVLIALVSALFRRELRIQSRMRRSVRNIWWCLALVAGAIFACALLMATLDVLLGNEIIDQASGSWLVVNWVRLPFADEASALQALSRCFVHPVAEEFLFRGMLFLTLLRIVGKWPGLILSGVFCGAYHQLAPQAGIYIFLLNMGGALIDGTIYLATGRLRWSVLSHVLWNSHMGFFPFEIPSWGITL